MIAVIAPPVGVQSSRTCKSWPRPTSSAAVVASMRPFEIQSPRQVRVRPERVGEVPSGEARLLNRLLRVHAVDRDVEEQLHHRRALGIAAGGAKWHQELSVLECDSGIRRESRSFPWLKRRRMFGVEPCLGTA